jgi:hypothetical protein
MKRLLLGLIVVGLFAAPAHAAFILIDDTDLATITITAGDFEEGFFVNGVLLTIGLGSSGSITLPDGGNTIGGSWIDLGAAGGSRVDLLFALAGSPTGVTSGVEFGAATDGLLATLVGSVGGFTGLPYFITALPTLLQNGQVAFSGMPFLSVEFRSEAVPEPALLALFGTALVVARRKRRV